MSIEHPTAGLWGVYAPARVKWVLMGSAVFLSQSPCCAGRQNLVLPQSALTHSSANTELHLKLWSCCPCRLLCQATPQTREIKEGIFRSLVSFYLRLSKTFTRFFTSSSPFFPLSPSYFLHSSSLFHSLLSPSSLPLHQ